MMEVWRWYYTIWWWATAMLPVPLWLGVLIMLVRSRGLLQPYPDETVGDDEPQARRVRSSALLVVCLPLLGAVLGAAVLLVPASLPSRPLQLLFPLLFPGRGAEFEYIIIGMDWLIVSIVPGWLTALLLTYGLLLRRIQRQARSQGASLSGAERRWLLVATAAVLIGLVVTALSLPLLLDWISGRLF